MKKAIMTSMFALGFCAVMAQRPAQMTEEIEVFNPHWYIQVQPLGIQYTLGENSFSELLSYNVQLGGGYNFTKELGVRLSINAWQSRAGSSKFLNGNYLWKWKYINPALDLTVNLSNVFGEYRADRKFNWGLVAGIGANIAFSNDEAADAKAQMQANKYENINYLWDGTKSFLTGRLGATVDYSINEKFAVGAEVQANIVGDKYNSKDANNSDWYFNALVGVKINLGPTSAKKTVKRDLPPCDCPEPAPAPAQTFRQSEAPQAAAVAEVKVEPLRRDVFFSINSKTPVGEDLNKIREVAYYMIQNMDAKVTITGYADKGTGSAAINKRLSQNRADAVCDILIKQYGIDSSRISKEALGDTEQPFTENDKNRVAICIAK